MSTRSLRLALPEVVEALPVQEEVQVMGQPMSQKRVRIASTTVMKMKNQLNSFQTNLFKEIEKARLYTVAPISTNLILSYLAEHVLGLCTTSDQLQRAGQELLMFQEHNLFNLLRYMKYLVDTMTAHDVIWGVGRGSSVSSYVLYLLGVHKIDSMFYDLDPGEFLR
jgi:DNA polymerase III alpha subunit